MYFKKKFLNVVLATYFLSFSIALTQNVKVGSFKLQSTSEEILGQEAAEQFESILELDEKITWRVYVPEDYDENNPPGILLYQIYGGTFEEPIGWKSALNEKNLILVRVTHNGSLIEGKEMLLGVLSLPLLQNQYNIDTSRVYNIERNNCVVGGLTAKYYPHVFKGSIFVNCIPASWKDDIPDNVDLMRDNRFLFIHSPKITRAVGIRQTIRRYNSAGIMNTKHEVPSMLDPGSNLDRRLLNSSIDYLDGLVE